MGLILSVWKIEPSALFLGNKILVRINDQIKADCQYAENHHCPRVALPRQCPRVLMNVKWYTHLGNETDRVQVDNSEAENLR